MLPNEDSKRKASKETRVAAKETGVLGAKCTHDGGADNWGQTQKSCTGNFYILSEMLKSKPKTREKEFEDLFRARKKTYKS